MNECNAYYAMAPSKIYLKIFSIENAAAAAAAASRFVLFEKNRLSKKKLKRFYE